WSRARALEVVEEYRRYCFLACVAGRMMSPSDAVDQVWHLHLTYSRDYWDVFCRDVLRAPLHHEPSRGGGNELARHRAQYADTLAEYERWFGAPPSAHWPSTYEQFRAPSRWQRVDRERVIVWRRPDWRRPWVALAALLGAGTAQAASANPLDWSGGTFLLLYAALAVVTIPATLILRRILRTAAMKPGNALDPYELAYLGGGTSRVADTAVAELLATGAARIDGRNVAVHHAPSGAHPIVAATARSVASDPQAKRLATSIEPQTVVLRQNLERRGLLLDDAGRRRVRLMSALLPAALVAFGAAKIAIGVSRDRPVAFLVVLTGLVGVFALFMLFRGPSRTSAGDSVLANARREHARAARAPREPEIALAVALLGTAALSGTAYAAWHEQRMPQTSDTGTSGTDGSSSYSSDSSSSDSSSSDSSSSDSSDSGGDSGGGGCGGCGGGGGD
ncbi:MAG TPA: TIGR04222 domain-containing membrane protein, partial [Xanthomonadales bacterium]|nr:TIGR04222 domain-containing membrane protein [Xanthomonadales bacterium]